MNFKALIIATVVSAGLFGLLAGMASTGCGGLFFLAALGFGVYAILKTGV